MIKRPHYWRLKAKRCLVSTLVISLLSQNALVVLASLENESDNIQVKASSFKATPSEAIYDNDAEALIDDESIATPSEAIYDDFVLIDDDIATPSEANLDHLLVSKLALAQSSVGDLWNDWIGNTSWNGEGTESNPYEISELSDLCGLAEMVAAGESFEGVYFSLTEDIDIGNLNKNWNPIGWYQNISDLSGNVSHPFKGNFEGNGNTISGLKITQTANTLNNVGLFGSIVGGSIKNLTVQADQISAENNIGILVGSVSGDTVIYNVTVEGYINAKGNAGGVAGNVVGSKKSNAGTVTIENCKANGVVINSSSNTGYVGGIAGSAQNTNLIDNRVLTYDGDSNRIQGKGYIGGIVGRANASNVYNSYVTGTIGGNGSISIGGVIGKYEGSSNLILARFDGTISRSNNGTSSHEGTFVGTRNSSDNFKYGVESSSNISYLFTTDAAKARKVFGSNIDNDNSFSSTANIGYWDADARRYSVVAGSNVYPEEDKYFYEELEAAVKFITVQKIGNNFDSESYSEGCDYKLDHFAPSPTGTPIKGYLVSVPRIDTKTAIGWDYDVATLKANGKASNTYYRTIDKDNPAAVAPGDTITVVTAAKNNANARYQMRYSEMEPGKVIPPTYTDEYGNVQDMNYVSGGTYSFLMPDSDTELNVEYIKVTTELTMSPAETTLKVVQTREGDRKSPSITTTVYDNTGKQIAKFIGDVSQVTPTPVMIHAEHNGEGSTNDKTVKWAVDNENLITLTKEESAEYTEKDAYIMPNLSSNFITNIINKQVKAQVDSGYIAAIDNTIYSAAAVVTATTNPDTSVNNIAVVGNSRVNVTFQIVDNTTRRVENLGLNMSDVTYTVTRKLTGDRINPVETITCNQPNILAATLIPSQPFFKNVTWNDKESGQIIVLTPTGINSENCKIDVRYDSNGQSNPAWIQNVINSDNQKRAEDKYAKLSGSASYKEIVTATSEDQTNGVITAKCNVTINFVTVDETVIHPEAVEMNQAAVKYDLAMTTKDYSTIPISKTGFNTVKLSCNVLPNITEGTLHEPFNKAVTWSVSDPNVLVIDQQGNILPKDDTDWIREAINTYPYKATKTVSVYATTKDQGRVGVTTVTLEVSITKTYSSSGRTGGSSGGSGGSGGSGVGSKGTVSGIGAGPGAKSVNVPQNAVSGTWKQTADGKWKFSTGEKNYINEWAYIYNPFAGENQAPASWFRFNETGEMVTGIFSDTDGQTYYLKPSSDGSLGAMLTGWITVDGKWYYFNPVKTETNPTGALLKNVVTPDGFVVNESGAWTLNGKIQIAN